jgi:hypothetical protein
VANIAHRLRFQQSMRWRRRQNALLHGYRERLYGQCECSDVEYLD